MDKKEEKKSIILKINYIFVALSFLIYGYALVITTIANNYDKSKDLITGSILKSKYCVFINSMVNYKLLIVLIGIVLIAYIVMAIVAEIKKEKCMKILFIGFVVSIVLCLASSTIISECNVVDTKDNKTPKIEIDK